MTLNDWQERLTKHFREIRKLRTSVLGDKAVFALEHGLSKAERTLLSDDIKTHISQGYPDDMHWLPWVVYATELGYDYDGDEYWQSFEHRTPAWIARGSRSWIRQCFWRFHQAYAGARPSGRWAQHFSIICWPITHAILPVDLQRQMAQVLYNLRYSFRPELFKTPELLGNEIGLSSWRFSSRFQNLAQEPLLVGQIAAALLLQEDEKSHSLILPDALLRIGQDLDAERRAREWLRDAQGVARARLSGVTQISIGGLAQVADLSASGQLHSLGIEPRILLRPIQGSWEVVLEVPDLAPLLYRFPALRGTLDQSICWVAGSSGRPLARGRLFHYGPQMVVLRNWPKPSEVLLRFEKGSSEVDYLLSAECMLRAGPTWLFKVSADGTANEIRGKVIRSGFKYLLLSSDQAISVVGYEARSIEIECEGVSGCCIEPGPAPTVEVLEQYRQLGLSPATGLEVSPAGPPPAKWDGEGHIEWLSTDRPCICLSGDHPFEGICLNLQGPAPQILETSLEIPGEPLFIDLGELPSGNHTLHLILQPQSAANNILTGRIDIVIREPRAWTKELTDQNPLLVTVDPPNPSLEQLWAGAVDIELHGPPARFVSSQLLFFRNKITRQPSFERQLPGLRLPVVSSDWRRFFNNIRQDEATQSAYDEAVLAEMSFQAAELGLFHLTCERESSPLR